MASQHPRPAWVPAPPSEVLTGAEPAAGLDLWTGDIEEVFEDGRVEATVLRVPDGERRSVQLRPDAHITSPDSPARAGDQLAVWCWWESACLQPRQYAHLKHPELSASVLAEVRALLREDDALRAP